MKNMAILDRLLFLIMVIVASYQVVAGINKFEGPAVFYYTITFGVLIIAGLLLILFGYEILKNTMVVVIAAFIPLSLSLGLIFTYFPEAYIPYLVFAIAGLILIVLTRYSSSRILGPITLAIVHGIAGLTIFILPILLYAEGSVSAYLLFVSLGAGLIGIGGILLALLQTGKTILPQKLIFSFLPWILLLMSIAFSAGLQAT